MKYICKMDYRGRPAYIVRLPTFEEGKPVWKKIKRVRFNAETYGSMNKALEAATEYRDEYFREHDKLLYLTESGHTDTKRKNFSANNTGVIGVFFAEATKKTGATHYSYGATWQEDKKIKRKTFSVIKHGTEKAFLKACEERFKHAGPLKLTAETPFKVKEEWL